MARLYFNYLLTYVFKYLFNDVIYRLHCVAYFYYLSAFGID
jgi:hypothetical protein